MEVAHAGQTRSQRPRPPRESFGPILAGARTGGQANGFAYFRYVSTEAITRGLLPRAVRCRQGHFDPASITMPCQECVDNFC